METVKKTMAMRHKQGEKNPRALKPQLNAAVLLFSFISRIFKGTQVSPGQARALEESSQHVQTRLFNAPLEIPT